MSNDTLIHIISQASSRYGDRLIDFLERYHLSGLIEATTEQLEEYIKVEELNREVETQWQMPKDVYVAANLYPQRASNAVLSACVNM